MSKKLPAGMSLLDYLWTTFSDYEPGDIVTSSDLKEYLKEYTKGGITDIEITPNSIILYGSNGIIKTLKTEAEDHLIGVKSILSTLVEIDNDICSELDIPLIEFTMKSGKKYYISEQYTGIETNSIKTSIVDRKIISHLKLDKSIEVPVIDVDITKNGLKIDLSINDEDKLLRLEKTEAGLDIKNTWNNGDNINFKELNYNEYSLTLKVPGTIYFINDQNCIYLNGVKYGLIPTASDTRDGLMSKEDKKTLDNIPDVYVTKELMIQSLDILLNHFITLLKNYALKSGDELANVIKLGGDIIIVDNVKSTKGYTLTKDSNIDLNGHTLDADSNGNYGDNIVIGNGANVTISNGTINPALKATESNASATIIVKTAYASTLTLNDCKVTGIYPLYVNSANEDTLVTINGGEFYSTSNPSNPDNMPPAIYVGKGSAGSTIGGKVVINGGTFGQKGVTNNYLLNVEDVLRLLEGKEPRDFIEVFGGTFINFDPSNNKSEGPETNFVAEGKTVQKIQDGDDIIYKVV